MGSEPKRGHCNQSRFFGEQVLKCGPPQYATLVSQMESAPVELGEEPFFMVRRSLSDEQSIVARVRASDGHVILQPGCNRPRLVSRRWEGPNPSDIVANLAICPRLDLWGSGVNPLGYNLLNADETRAKICDSTQVESGRR